MGKVGFMRGKGIVLETQNPPEDHSSGGWFPVENRIGPRDLLGPAHESRAWRRIIASPAKPKPMRATIEPESGTSVPELLMV